MLNIDVSFLIIARNAEKDLSYILQDVLVQDYPLNNVEIILVDGKSEDRSLSVMTDFKHCHPDLTIKILDNPERILAAGWNKALSNSVGDILLRVDAHSRIPVDFIRKNVECITAGQKIVGGHRATIIPPGAYQQVISLAEISRFGAGGALYRNAGKPGYVDTLAHAAYSRHVFEVVGGYDERLVRTEDNDMHYRMRRAGFRFYYNPEIKSFHTARGNLRGLLKQKYSNGFWIGLTMGIQPKCFGLRHFIPLFFVVVLLISVLLGLVGAHGYFFVFLIGIYLMMALFFSFEAVKKAKPNAKIFCLGLPLIFFLIHISYGLGTLIGLILMPYFVWKNRSYEIPFPVKPEI